jgi:hypothetical protein
MVRLLIDKIKECEGTALRAAARYANFYAVKTMINNRALHFNVTYTDPLSDLTLTIWDLLARANAVETWKFLLSFAFQSPHEKVEIDFASKRGGRTFLHRAGAFLGYAFLDLWHRLWGSLGLTTNDDVTQCNPHHFLAIRGIKVPRTDETDAPKGAWHGPEAYPEFHRLDNSIRLQVEYGIESGNTRK